MFHVFHEVFHAAVVKTRTENTAKKEVEKKTKKKK